MEHDLQRAVRALGSVAPAAGTHARAADPARHRIRRRAHLHPGARRVVVARHLVVRRVRRRHRAVCVLLLLRVRLPVGVRSRVRRARGDEGGMKRAPGNQAVEIGINRCVYSHLKTHPVSFFRHSNNTTISIHKIKTTLGFTLHYPSANSNANVV
ncbi:hypothetical protein BCEP4_1640023 [Burkholderia cepacia]|nr:hypothetical protein BCEP4_1640023 [Burkholderia cepacia]